MDGSFTGLRNLTFFGIKQSHHMVFMMGKIFLFPNSKNKSKKVFRYLCLKWGTLRERIGATVSASALLLLKAWYLKSPNLKSFFFHEKNRGNLLNFPLPLLKGGKIVFRNWDPKSTNSQLWCLHQKLQIAVPRKPWRVCRLSPNLKVFMPISHVCVVNMKWRRVGRVYLPSVFHCPEEAAVVETYGLSPLTFTSHPSIPLHSCPLVLFLTLRTDG